MSPVRTSWSKLLVGLVVGIAGLVFPGESAMAGQQAFPVPRSLLIKSDFVDAYAGGAPVYESMGTRPPYHLVRVTSAGAKMVPGSQASRFNETFGSPTHLAFTTDDNRGDQKLSLGPAAGPLSPVSSCVAFGTSVLTDEALAYGFLGCNGPASAKVIDLRSGTPRLAGSYTDASPGQPTSMAGHMIAYVSGSQIVVRDWTTGQLVQSITAEAPRSRCSPNAPEGPTLVDCSFAVDTDGSVWQLPDTIEFACGENCSDQGTVIDHCDGRVDRTPPGGPTQTVATPACTASSDQVFYNRALLVSAGRVLYQKPGSQGVDNSATWLAGTDGASSQVSDGVLGTPFTPNTRSPSALAFTGTTLTVPTSSCTKVVISTLSLPLASPLGISGPSCPVKMSNGVLQLGRHPTLTVSIACPHGCVGPLFICPPGFYGCPLSGPAVGTSGNFSLGNGTRKRVTLRLRPRSALVRNAAHRQRVRVTVSDALLADDPRQPWLGDTKHVSLSVQVRGARR